MKTEMLNENNLDEVTFEKRNKNYGAYYLRKKYDNNVSIALTISITLLLLTVAIPLIANYMHAERLIRESTTVGAELIGVTKTNEAVLPPKPPPLPELISKKVIFIAPKVVEDTTDLGPIFTQADLNELRKNEKVNDTFVIIDNDQNDKKIIEDDKDHVVHEYSGVEEKPDFPGGVAEMNKFIAENIKYPKLASENKIQGKVMIAFIVEADGSLSNINVKKSIGAGCDEEAERVIKLMPKWTPGKQNNQPVRVEVMVPIKFTIVF